MNLRKDIENLQKLSVGEHSLEEVASMAGVTIDGSVFMCSSHGLDYRLLCDECKEKNEKFSKVVKGMVRK